MQHLSGQINPQFVNKLVNRHQPKYDSLGMGCSDSADKHASPGTPTASTPGTAAVKSRRRVWCAQDKHQCRSGANLAGAILARKVPPFYPPAFVASFFLCFQRRTNLRRGFKGDPGCLSHSPHCRPASKYRITLYSIC